MLKKYLDLKTIIIILFVAIVYILTIPGSFTEGEDGLSYVNSLKREEWRDLFQANHLIFILINWVAFKIVSFFAFVDVLHVVIGVNIIFALLIFIVMSHVVDSLNLPFDSKFFAITSTAFSFVFWIYSVAPESYTMPVFFCLLTCLRTVEVVRFPGVLANWVLLSVCLVLSVLVQQQSVLLFPAILSTIIVFLWGRKRLIVSILSFSVISFLFVVAAYVFVSVKFFKASDFGEIIDWSKGNYFGHPSYSFLKFTLMMVVGVFRSIWGGYFLLKFEAFKGIIDYFFHHKILLEDFFLADQIPYKLAILLLPLCLFSICLFISFIVLSFKRGKVPIDRERKIYVFFSIIYIVTTLGFTHFYHPFSHEILFSIIPFLFIVFCLLLVGKDIKYGFWIFPFSIFIVNLFGNVLPQKDIYNDFWHFHYQYLFDLPESDEIIVFAGFEENAELYTDFIPRTKYQYYLKPKLIYFYGKPFSEVLKKMDENKDKRIYFSSWLIKFIGSAEEEKNYRLLLDYLQKNSGTMKIVQENEDHTIWEIQFN